MNFGAEVEVILKDGSKFKGILIPRPKMLSQDVIILKLSSGYNIGIKKSKIKKMKLIKKYKQKKPKKIKIKKNPGLPNVTVISTGGTISSRVDYRTGGVYADYTAEDFIRFEPRVKKFANIEALPLMNKMSEDINPKDWIKIAKAAYKELKKGNSVVITHGTDTMHFTSAALSFMLKTNKPVILTGAQRSSDRPSSDAYMNFLTSVYSATQDIPAVAVCMHATMNDDYCAIHIGTRVRKMHSSRRDAFKSIGVPPIAFAWPEGHIKFNWKPKETTLSLDAKLNEKVVLLYAFPTMDLIKEIDADGIVIAGTGLGHVPDKAFKQLKKLGIPIVITTQTLHGRVHPYVYSNLRKLSKAGFIFAEDMLPETAYVKLMYVLAHDWNVGEAMLKNFAYEITSRSVE